jgi:hypothetical protein
MDRTTVTRLAVILFAVLAAISVFPSPGGGSPSVATQPRSTDCGTYPSTSIYATGRVIAIRRVSCDRALAVAQAFDRSGKQLGRWRCGLSHADLPSLFSCGKGGKRGNLRRWPHALRAVGVGMPQPLTAAR